MTDRYAERRAQPRYPTRIEVDYAAEGTFLFAYITDISAMGIFIRAERTHSVGTRLQLRLGPAAEAFELCGEVVWTTDGSRGHEPGMGIRFEQPTEQERNRLQELIAAVAYVE